jgi:hypothetical protein
MPLGVTFELEANLFVEFQRVKTEVFIAVGLASIQEPRSDAANELV